MTRNASKREAIEALRVLVNRTQPKLPARLFRDDGGGSYTATAPGGRGMTYVRLYQGEDATQLTQAIDRLGVSSPTDDDKAVWIYKDADQFWYIREFRYEGT